MKNKNNSSRRLFLAVLLLLVLMFGYLFPNLGLGGVDAAGNSPLTCPNRYNSYFTSFAIDTGTQKIDAITNPGMTFSALTNEGYNVSFVLHTAIYSSNGNTRKGTTWYSDNVYGNSLGVCVGQESNGKLAVGSDQNVLVNLHVSMDPQYDPGTNGGKQQVIWQDWPGLTGPYYNVVWVEQTSLILSCYAQSELITCVSKVTGNSSPLSGAFGSPTGNVKYALGSFTIGSCALESSSSSCSLSFTPTHDGSISITAFYSGDSFHAPSSNVASLDCCSQPSTTSSTSSPTTTSSPGTTSISSDPSSSATSYTTNTSTDETNSSPSTPTTHLLPPSLGPGGLGFGESMAALIVSAVVIAGILGFAIKKGW